MVLGGGVLFVDVVEIERRVFVRSGHPPPPRPERREKGNILRASEREKKIKEVLGLVILFFVFLISRWREGGRCFLRLVGLSAVGFGFGVPRHAGGGFMQSVKLLVVLF